MGHLKIYFPQMLDWFDRLDTELVCALLERWPTLEELQRVAPAKLRTFFHKYHCRDQELTERRIVAIRQAIPAIRDRAVIEANSTLVTVIVQLIRSLVEGVANLDEKVEEEAAAAHPDFFIFDSLPGAGATPALVGGVWLAARALQQRTGSLVLQRDRTGDGEQREEAVGAFPRSLPEVPTAKFSRMGGPLHCVLSVGTKLLPKTTQQRQRTPRRCTSVSF